MSAIRDTNPLVSCIIVAAGKSSRMKMDKSKQFIDLEGMPVLARTIQTFQNTGIIHEIILVVNEDAISYCKAEVVEKYGFTKVTRIIAGGAERQASVYNGILNTREDASIVVIHDGARPFVPEEIILSTIDGARRSSSCVCAVPVKDTIKKVSEKSVITETLERSSLRSIQTPQAFCRGIILEAHQKAIENGFDGTDDAVLVERLGIPTLVVEGSYLNIKITTAEDLLFSKAILKFI